MGRPRKWSTDAERMAAARAASSGAETASTDIEIQPLAFDAARVDPEPEVAVERHGDRNDPEPEVDAIALVSDDDLDVVDDHYRGFEIADVGVQDDAHRYLFAESDRGAFYVRSPRGTIGLVPFPGSTVVWPWEAGWAQDLARANRVEPENERPTDLDWFLRHTKGGS